MRTVGGRRILLTRAAEQAEGTAARLRALGHCVVIAPLVRIERLDAALPEQSQAILVTSHNGAEALAAAISLRSVPVLAVGNATAQALQDAGFAHVRSANGDASALSALAMASLNPRAGPVIHARGAEIRRSPLTPLNQAGFTTAEAILYRTVALRQLPPDALTCDTALIYSPGSARRLCQAYPADAHPLDLITISDAARKPLENAPFARTLHTATHPSEDAMIDLLTT